MLIRSERSSLTNIDRSLKKLQDIKWNLVCQTGLMTVFFFKFFLMKSQELPKIKNIEIQNLEKNPPPQMQMIQLT